MNEKKKLNRCEHMIFYPRFNMWACDGTQPDCSQQEWKCDYNDKDE
jgi:hypothetical protein